MLSNAVLMELIGDSPVHLRLQSPTLRLLLPLPSPCYLPTIRDDTFPPHPDPRGLCPPSIVAESDVD